MGGQVAAPFYPTCSSARVLDEFSKSIPPTTKPSTKKKLCSTFMTLIYSRNGFHANRCRNSTCFDYKYVIQQNKHIDNDQTIFIMFLSSTKIKWHI